MALGPVQSGYAGTSYAYRRTTGVKEESYSDIFRKAQMKENEDVDESRDKKENVDLMQFIRERMDEIFAKVQKDDTEESFQIGGSSFTIKEWEEFLEKFDDAEDAIRELMKEEQAKRAEEAERTEIMKEIWASKTSEAAKADEGSEENKA